MMNRQDCEGLLVQHGASNTEAKLMVDALLEEKRKVLAAGGNIQQLSAQWSERAQHFAKETQRKEYLKALGLLRYSQLGKEVDALTAQGASYEDAIRTLLAGQSTYRTGGRRSVAALKDGIYNSWAGGLVNELEKIDGAIGLLQKDPAFEKAVFYEMREPGTSTDKTVQETAKTFAKYMELSRTQLNDAGAYIGHIDGWTPQNHDPYKIVGKLDEWKKYVRDRLDIDRTFPGATEAEIDQALTHVYQDINLGKPMFIPDSYSGKPKTIPARKFEHSRVLHFKDAQSAYEYHQQYGRGNIFAAMVTHLDHASRALSILQRMGPDPYQTLEKLVARADYQIRNSALPDLKKMEDIKSLRSSLRDGSIRNIMREVTGEINVPVNAFWAKVGNGLRMIQNMAKLGAASLSAIADPFIKAAQIRTVTGDNWFSAIQKSVTQYCGALSSDTRETARKLGAYLDHMRIEISSRWDSNAGAEGVLGRLQETFFKASGLDWITERGKAAYSLFLSSEIGGQAGKAWADVNPALKATLKFHGVDETRWNIMQKMTRQEGEYTYFLPEMAETIAEKDLLPMLPQKYQGQPPAGQKAAAKWQRGKDHAIREARQKLQFEAMGMIADETRFAVIEPDAATRAIMRQGQAPGTYGGELWRAMMQFKGFPIAYMQRVLGGRRWVRMDRQAGMRRGWNVGSAVDAVTTDMTGLIGFIMSSLAFGYAAGVCKDISKGREPRDPKKLETWLAAAVQSGGAGILGDFVLGKVNRFGNSFLETVAGPSLGMIGDAIKPFGSAVRGDFANAGEDTVRLIMANTPYVNLWYTRSAVDWLFLYHVREMMSPGTLRRAKKKMWEDFGQRDLFDPTRYIRKGGGFKNGVNPVLPWTWGGR